MRLFWRKGFFSETEDGPHLPARIGACQYPCLVGLPSEAGSPAFQDPWPETRRDRRRAKWREPRQNARQDAQPDPIRVLA